jgi:uncharacterized membrane protein YphA (DoxX/SURF4 family)
LLLLRTVLGLTLLVQGACYVDVVGPSAAPWLVGLTAMAAGAALLAGFLTPIAAVLAGLGGVGVGLSVLPVCARNVFDSFLAMLLAATILVAVLLLGPGAFSVDARLFGRREIIIPPISRKPR